MKSSLTFSMLYQYAIQENRKSAYFTLEQGKDLILEQMASMGMADPRAAEQIATLDMGNIRKNLNYLQGRGSWIELFKMYCKNVMKAEPISVLVVDSLDVLETMAKMQDRRTELYFLFEWLRHLVTYTGGGPGATPRARHPRVASGAHRSAMAQTTPSEVAGANSAAPVAVLVVDGNEDHQILSIAALTRKGWIVRTAASRKQGLQLALAYHFDAVVIGSKLRDGNGIELLRGLGGRLPGTPIIFVVPLGGEEAALQAMESGAQSYIVKTPRYNELLPAIVEEHVVEARNRKRLVETAEVQAHAQTARKTVEEQLSQSQTRLKLVLEQAPVLLWSTDRDLRVTSAMGTGFRDLNLRRSERGLSIYEYFNIHDDDIEPIVSHRRALLGESVATQIEWQGRTYDVHMEPFRSKDGAVIGTIGVAFDVSERTRTEESLRRSEERFQLLGRATNDVVWDWDLQTDGMWMNDNVAAMFGYRAEDVEPTGTWWEERLHPDDRARVGSSLDDVIGSGGSLWSAEYPFRRDDGPFSTSVDRGTVLHHASGPPVRLVGSVRVVCKERKAEAIQSAVYKISEAANAAKDLPELYRHIHKVIGGLMPATNFYIALYDDRAQTLTFPYFVDEEEGPPPPQKLGRGLTEYVLRTGRPLLASPTVFAELNRSGEVEQVGPPSVDWVGAPLVGLGKTFG